MDEMKAQIVDSEIGSKCLKLVDHSGAVFVNHGHMGRGTFFLLPSVVYNEGCSGKILHILLCAFTTLNDLKPLYIF